MAYSLRACSTGFQSAYDLARVWFILRVLGAERHLTTHPGRLSCESSLKELDQPQQRGSATVAKVDIHLADLTSLSYANIRDCSAALTSRVTSCVRNTGGPSLSGSWNVDSAAAAMCGGASEAMTALHHAFPTRVQRGMSAGIRLGTCVVHSTRARCAVTPHHTPRAIELRIEFEGARTAAAARVSDRG